MKYLVQIAILTTFSFLSIANDSNSAYLDSIKGVHHFSSAGSHSADEEVFCKSLNIKIKTGKGTPTFGKISFNDDTVICGERAVSQTDKCFSIVESNYKTRVSKFSIDQYIIGKVDVKVTNGVVSYFSKIRVRSVGPDFGWSITGGERVELELQKDSKGLKFISLIHEGHNGILAGTMIGYPADFKCERLD